MFFLKHNTEYFRPVTTRSASPFSNPFALSITVFISVTTLAGK